VIKRFPQFKEEQYDQAQKITDSILNEQIDFVIDYPIKQKRVQR